MMSTMSKISRRGLLAALGLGALAGCVGGRPRPDTSASGPDMPLAPQLDAQELDQARTDFVGDTSAVIAVLEAARLPQSGKYTIEIGSGQQPYGLTINFDELTARMLDQTQHRRLKDTAVLVMALVANAEWVAWNFPNDTALPPAGRLELADANEFVGFDIKLRTRDQAGVQQLLDALTAHPYPNQPTHTSQPASPTSTGR